MTRLHIVQDETGFWQLALEGAGGQMSLISHQFSTPDHLIDDARELVEKGSVPPDTVILIGPPRHDRSAIRVGDYRRPAPRKAGE